MTINTANITWEGEVPTSTDYQDIYFSKENGLEESTHIFINNNNLPERFKNTTSHFTILETGFGTGLNLLNTLAHWEEHAPKHAILRYISIEKHPLLPHDLTRSIVPFGLKYAPLLIQHYNLEESIMRIIHKNINISIYLSDINYILDKIQNTVDAWFLDGFAPAKNPDMWSEALYKNMNRLTLKQGTFSTFTSASNIRKNIEKAGFNVEKVPGFGKKRESLMGYKL